MTLPVPNQQSAVVKVIKDAKGVMLGYLIPPWNSWFQQFSQKAPDVASVNASPFTANANGTVIISSGATGTTLTRGLVNIVLGAGQKIIPISIGDTVSWTGPATVKFLGA